MPPDSDEPSVSQPISGSLAVYPCVVPPHPQTPETDRDLNWAAAEAPEHATTRPAGSQREGRRSRLCCQCTPVCEAQPLKPNQRVRRKCRLVTPTGGPAANLQPISRASAPAPGPPPDPHHDAVQDLVDDARADLAGIAGGQHLQAALFGKLLRSDYHRVGLSVGPPPTEPCQNFLVKLSLVLCD